MEVKQLSSLKFVAPINIIVAVMADNQASRRLANLCSWFVVNDDTIASVELCPVHVHPQLFAIRQFAHILR
jgi:hypothetical protein